MIPGVTQQQQIFVPCDVFETPTKKTSKQASKKKGLLVAEKLRDAIRAAPDRSFSHAFFALRDELVADALNTMHTGSTRDTRVVRGDSSASASADTRQKTFWLSLKRFDYDAMKDGRKLWEARPLTNIIKATFWDKQSLCKQAEDRCHRMGQKKPVEVVQVVVKDSVI